MLRRRKKRERAAAAAQAQLSSVKDRIAPAVHQAAHEARGRGSQVAERVGPVAATARDKAAHTARERVVPAAITAKDVAIEKATPVVETARDKVVDDLLPRLAKPALVVHGAHDAVVKPSIVDQHKAGMPHAQVCVMPDAGHAPFWEDAAAFNQQLRAFCRSL